MLVWSQPNISSVSFSVMMYTLVPVMVNCCSSFSSAKLRGVMELPRFDVVSALRMRTRWVRGWTHVVDGKRFLT